MFHVCHQRGGAGFYRRLNEALGKHTRHICCCETSQNHETVVVYMNLQAVKLYPVACHSWSTLGKCTSVIKVEEKKISRMTQKRWLLSCDK